MDYQLLLELTSQIENKYNVKPSIDMSACTLKPGMNIKYKKSGKSLCVIYPNEDSSFDCMVVIGRKQMNSFDELLPSLDDSIQDIYESTKLYNNTYWLMIPVKNQIILEDVLKLIDLKVNS